MGIPQTTIKHLALNSPVGLWAFIEIYGQESSIPNVKFVLAGSLMVSAVGSAIPYSISDSRVRFFVITGVIVSAISGSMVYLSATFVTFTSMLLTNSFFLFLFLPLYLSKNVTLNRASNAQTKTALYLFGIAIGGIAGGFIISSFGYDFFAILISISALPALVAFVQPTSIR